MVNDSDTVFDQLIAMATITFSKEYPAATMRRQLLWSAAHSVYMEIISLF